MKVNAANENFDLIMVLGEISLFTQCRVDRETVPENLYVYDLRHTDDDDSLIASIEERVIVNHMGTIISKHPIPLENGYRDLTTDDWSFVGYGVTLETFINVDYATNSPDVKN